jgi:hypothetical protein
MKCVELSMCHISGMMLTGGNKEVRDKLVPVPILLPQIPKGSNPGFCGETSTAYCLSCG